jgi:hypothetical protein
MEKQSLAKTGSGHTHINKHWKKGGSAGEIGPQQFWLDEVVLLANQSYASFSTEAE